MADKKKKGLTLDPNPVLLDDPSKKTTLDPHPVPLQPTRQLSGDEIGAPREWGEGWRPQLELDDEPVMVTPFQSLEADDQRGRTIEIFEANRAKDMQWENPDGSIGRYPKVSQPELYRYLEAKYGGAWTDDFWDKTIRGATSAAKMVGEDLVVGLVWKGPRDMLLAGVFDEGEKWAFDAVKKSELKPKYAKNKLFQIPQTAHGLRRYGFQSENDLGRGPFVQALYNIHIEETMAGIRLARTYTESIINEEDKQEAEKRLVKQMKLLAKEGFSKARQALPWENMKELDRLKLKSVSDLFDKGKMPDMWSAKGVWNMAKAVYRIGHPLGQPKRSAATIGEAIARGTGDISIIGHMITGNVFDNTRLQQSKANKHMNGRLNQYWKKRGEQYKYKGTHGNKPDLDNVPGKLVQEWRDEIPETYRKLNELRADRWRFMQIMITDRERARLGHDPMISQFLRTRGHDKLADQFKAHAMSKNAEAWSYGLDPVTLGTMGAGAVLKLPAKAGVYASGKVAARQVATPGILRRGASGALVKGGGIIETVGEKLTYGAAKLPSEGASGIIAGLGVGAVTDAPLVTAAAIGGIGGKTFQPVAKLASLADSITGIGKTVRVAGGVIKDPQGYHGFMQKLSLASSAPEAVRQVAGNLSFVDPVINWGAATFKGSATGGGIGATIAVASGGDPEFGGAAVMVGGLLGGMTATPMHLVTSTTKAKLQTDVASWIARQPENVREHLAKVDFENQAKMFEMDILVKGLGAYEGRGDVVVEYVHDKDWNNNGAWMGDEGRLVVNMAYDGPRGMFHEVGHAIKSLAKGEAEGSPAREAYEKFRSVLYERKVGDVTLEGLYSIDDQILFGKQYHEHMKRSASPEELLAWENRTGFNFKTAELTKEHFLANENVRNLIQSEIEADAWMQLIEGSKPGAILKAGKWTNKTKQKLLNHIMLSEHSRTAARMRWGLELFGVKFDDAGNVSPLFKKDGKGTTNNQEVNQAITDLIAVRKAVKKQVVPEAGEIKGQVFSIEEVRSNPGLVEYFGAHDAFARDNKGKIVYVNGKPVMLPQRQVRKLQRERMKAMVSALEGVDETGGVLMELTTKGKKRWKGRNLNEDQVNALLNLPDDIFSPRLKDNLRFLNDVMKNGDSIHIDYNARIRGGKYSSEISAAWRHEMPFGLEITQAGNFLIKGINVDRIHARIAKWRRDKKGRYLDLWEEGGLPDYGRFLGDVYQYMSNHQKGLPGRTGLHADEGKAAAKAHRINELFYVYGSEEARPTTVGAKPTRVEGSYRFDGINQGKKGGEEWSANYGLLKRSYMPAEKPGARFMPSGEPKLGGKKGSLVPKKERVKTGAPPRVKLLEEAAQRVDEMSAKEWAKKVESLGTIRPVADDRIPTHAELRVMDEASQGALKVPQQKQVRKPTHGDLVDNVRIDIPGYQKSAKTGTPVHPIAFKDSKGTGYTGHLVLDDVSFTYGSAERALKIAQGGEKTTLAFANGRVNTRNIPTRVELLRTDASGERVWTQVGYNPTKHGYFFDKHNPSMIVQGGDRALLAGNTVYVRNAIKETAVKTPGLVRMGDGPEVRYMPRGDSHALKIIKGTEKPEGLPKNPTVTDLARYFQERVAEPIDFTKSTPGQEIRVEDSLYKETKHAVKIHPEAKGWYDENLGLAMTVLRELDSDIGKTENAFIYKAMLTVTSDGNAVGGQFTQAWKTYDHWKKTGKIVSDFASGDRIKNIRKNIVVIDKLNKKLGAEKAVEWLTRKGTVTEMRESAVKDLGFSKEEAMKMATSELVDEVVPFATGLFGPKLGSFFNNLHGDYGTVTMDRWFMRTMGRNTGTQVKEPSPKQWGDAKRRLRLAVDSLSAADRKKLGISKASVTGDKALATSKKLGVYFAVKKNRTKVTAKINETRLAANAIAKMQKPLIEAPQNGRHRRWIRARIDAVQKRLKAEGVDLENADLQALLWYNEKELYDAAGVRGPKGANDYAAAAAALHAAVRGRPSKGYAKGTGRVGGIGRGKGGVGLGEPPVDFMPAGKDASPGWISNTEKAFDKILEKNPSMKAMKGQSMYNALKKHGALEEEVKWIQDLDTGEALDTWMKRQDKVTQQQVKDFIAKNQIEVLERTYGGKARGRGAPEEIEHAQRQVEDLEDELGVLHQESRMYDEVEVELDAARIRLENLEGEGGPQFGGDDLVLPGAKEGSYRELVLRVPSPEKVPKVTVEKRPDSTGIGPDTYKIIMEGGYEFQLPMARKRYATRAEAEVAAASIRKDPKLKKIPTRRKFTAAHFKDDPNVILHLRMNERVDADGKRMLFIEELQSDWAAKGRRDAFEIIHDEFKPSDKWKSLGMKRAIRWAAENGYDRLGWITGEDTAKRYNLEKHIKSIEFTRVDTFRPHPLEGLSSIGTTAPGPFVAKHGKGDKGVKPGAEPSQRDVLITMKDAKGFEIAAYREKRITAKDLENHVGKEMADRILTHKDEIGTIEGIDLEVGGKGHKQFYDIDLVNLVNKYTKKKWGAKVGSTRLTDKKTRKMTYEVFDERAGDELTAPAISKHDSPEGAAAAARANPNLLWREAWTAGEGATKAHYIDITPAMKESVMTEGQTMFMPTGSDASYMKAAKKGDTKGAQLLVDKAAKAAHMKGPFYHSTDEGKFNRFKTPAYFSNNEKWSKAWGDRTEAAYLSLKNPYEIDGEIAGRHFRWDAEDVAEMKADGHDGVHIKHSKGDVIAVFDPAQIKSADPITKDNKGNIIPLSERFNPKSDDIRYMPAGREYAGKHEAPTSDGGSPGHDVARLTYPDDIYGPKAAQYYGHYGQNNPMDVSAIRVIHGMKGNPNKAIEIYRAVPKGLKEPKLSTGDWVTITRKYAKEHGEATLEGSYEIISQSVHAKDIWTDGNSIHEWGYDPQTSKQLRLERDLKKLKRN